MQLTEVLVVGVVEMFCPLPLLLSVSVEADARRALTEVTAATGADEAVVATVLLLRC